MAAGPFLKVVGIYRFTRIEPVSVTHFPALLHQLRDQPGPAGLMARSRSNTGVAIRVLVKQQQIPPVGIGLNFSKFPKTGRRPSASRVKMLVSRRESSAATPQRHQLSGSSWKLDQKIVAEVVVELL
jgi:hypothetical protein